MHKIEFNAYSFIIVFQIIFKDLFKYVYRYLLQYQEPIPCEQVVATLCDIKQAYTQFGGDYVHDFMTLSSPTVWG